MRLIHSKTGALKEFMGDRDIPPHAILPHTWGGDEITYQDMSNSKVSQRPGYNKIKYCCEQAVRGGLEWVWIDTCYIDKSSSAELSEAINSMFRWYKMAEVCYAYLSDVPSDVDIEDHAGAFAKSRWFSRGWTLQELLAPIHVLFYSKDWSPLGTRSQLQTLLSSITGILPGMINSDGPSLCSVAMKMSWAANRETTRTEDLAYSLLGFFDVNMPLLYGEGEKAFSRLQGQILKSTNDQSISAWGYSLDIPRMEDFDAENSRQEKLKTFSSDSPQVASLNDSRLQGLLAESPASFGQCRDVVVLPSWPGNYGDPPIVYNKSIRIHLPVFKSIEVKSLHCAILGCSIQYDFKNLLGVVLKGWGGEDYFGRVQLVLVSNTDSRLLESRQIQARMSTIKIEEEARTTTNLRHDSILFEELSLFPDYCLYKTFSIPSASFRLLKTQVPRTFIF